MENVKSLQLRFQNKIQENNAKKLRILYIILIAVLLFIISLTIKGCVSLWYWKNHAPLGSNWEWFWSIYGGTWNWEDPVGIFGHVYEGETWYLETYVDAKHYYLDYLQSFRFENWNPYAGGTYPTDPLNGYAYGPMFIFGIYLISIIISVLYPNMSMEHLVAFSVKWTHIVFDCLCVVMVYLIIVLLKKFKYNEVKRQLYGVVAAVLFTWMPINLIYVDSAFLNTPQMTFFTLLSLLLMIKEKYRVGAFILSIAWLSKQMPLFLLIPWFFIVWRKKGMKTAFVEFLIPFLLTTVIISLPWFIMTPYPYLRKVFGPGAPFENFDPAEAFNQNGATVILSHSFLYLENEKLAEFYFNINNYMIPFLLFYILVVLFAYFGGKIMGDDESQFIIFSTWTIIGTHVFISRGIYKYYNAFITPFVVLSLLVFFDDLVPKLTKKIPLIISKSMKEKKGDLKEEKLNQDKTLSAIILFLTFIGFNLLFYYFNWVLIKNIRFLHPLYLLILFVVVSLLLHPSLAISFTKEQNYDSLSEDLGTIVGTVEQITDKVAEKTENFIEKLANWRLK